MILLFLLSLLGLCILVIYFLIKHKFHYLPESVAVVFLGKIKKLKWLRNILYRLVLLINSLDFHWYSPKNTPGKVFEGIESIHPLTRVALHPKVLCLHCCSFPCFTPFSQIFLYLSSIAYSDWPYKHLHAVSVSILACSPFSVLKAFLRRLR